jgi:hypothetical protein
MAAKSSSAPTVICICPSATRAPPTTRCRTASGSIGIFFGILRLDVDLRPGSLAANSHPAVHAGAYAIPPDNPFVGVTSFNGSPVNPAAVRSEFWATGLRNSWRLAFDPATGWLWCGDVGQNAREEINVIVRGGNYGWNYREGNIAGPRASPPAGVTFIPPVWDYPHSQGQSVTGGFVHRGTTLPGLAGNYLFADFVSGRVWSLLPDGDRPVSADRVQVLTTEAGVSSFGRDPATGDILLANLLQGTIKRLTGTTAPGATPFPATLAATGAFADLASLTPAPGVVPYEPNASFWSDHATKRRWFALTNDDSTFGFAPDSPWSLPVGAIWIKHFDLELTRGDPVSARRIETRFLVRTIGGTYGLTYRWNDAQTDATLVPDEGAEQDFTIIENGIVRTQTWHFPGRGECVACHTPAGGHALTFNTGGPRSVKSPCPTRRFRRQRRTSRPFLPGGQLRALPPARRIRTRVLGCPRGRPALAHRACCRPLARQRR